MMLIDDPFTDMYYLVGNDEMRQNFNLDEVLRITTQVNCGEYSASIKQVYGDK